jgi:4-hydroxybenzoate polyprenyltransferase
MLTEISQKFPKTSAFVSNLRFPQLLFHAGLVLVGFGLGIKYANPSWIFSFPDLTKAALLILGAWSAWITSVIVNDVVDLKIDQRSNPARPLPRKIFSVEEYLGVGLVFFLFSLLFSGLAEWRIIFFILLYQILAFFYSAWPMRLKRFPIIATLISALASILIAFGGFIIIAPDHSLILFPLPIATLLIIGYTLALPIKDFKDFEGDEADKVFTLPVLFGVPWAKVIVGSGLFFSFMLSVLVLDDFRLFWWAFLCGSASFVFIMRMKKSASESRLNYRTIFWWILGAITIYLGVIIYFMLK